MKKYIIRSMFYEEFQKEESESQLFDSEDDAWDWIEKNRLCDICQRYLKQGGVYNYERHEWDEEWNSRQDTMCKWDYYIQEIEI